MNGSRCHIERRTTGGFFSSRYAGRLSLVRVLRWQFRRRHTIPMVLRMTSAAPPSAPPMIGPSMDERFGGGIQEPGLLAKPMEGTPVRGTLKILDGISMSDLRRRSESMAISTHKYRLLMKREPKTYVVSKAFVQASIPLTQIPSERRTTSLDWSRTKLLPLIDIANAN